MKSVNRMYESNYSIVDDEIFFSSYKCTLSSIKIIEEFRNAASHASIWNHHTQVDYSIQILNERIAKWHEMVISRNQILSMNSLCSNNWTLGL